MHNSASMPIPMAVLAWRKSRKGKHEAPLMLESQAAETGLHWKTTAKTEETAKALVRAAAANNNHRAVFSVMSRRNEHIADNRVNAMAQG